MSDRDAWRLWSRPKVKSGGGDSATGSRPAVVRRTALVGAARPFVKLAVAMMTLTAFIGPLQAQDAKEALAPDALKPVSTTPISDGFTLAAVGDLIYLRPMLATIEQRSPDMLRILRKADAAFGNLETTVIDLSHFKGSPQAESGGTWMLADPKVLADVRAMGIGIVSVANNHVTDWGVEGLEETADRLDSARLVHAGSGSSLSAARSPRYLDLAAGRIGLVAATSTFTPMSRAADAYGEVPSRGGVNALRTQRIEIVDEKDLAVLDRVSDEKPGKSVDLGDVRYTSGAATVPPTTKFVMNESDEKANLLFVRQAKQNGNFAVFSLHNHEPDNAIQTPPDFAVRLAHEAIDAGADIFVGHGPHQLRGVEIYKRRPIFYSLGNFAMMNNSLDQLPLDMYDEYGVAPGSATTAEILQARNAREFSGSTLYESVIAVCRYIHGDVVEVRLYPIDLGVESSGADRGVPRLASAEVGQRILERLRRLSSPWGTIIQIEKNVGVIRVPTGRR